VQCPELVIAFLTARRRRPQLGPQDPRHTLQLRLLELVEHCRERGRDTDAAKFGDSAHGFDLSSAFP
jgi:hypothetical protein